jgi:hypothetical protein
MTDPEPPKFGDPFNDGVAMKYYNATRGGSPNPPAQQQPNPVDPPPLVYAAPPQKSLWQSIKEKLGMADPPPKSRIEFRFSDGSEKIIESTPGQKPVETLQPPTSSKAINDHPHVLRAGQAMTNALVTNIVTNISHNNIGVQTVGSTTNAPVIKR